MVLKTKNEVKLALEIQGLQEVCADLEKEYQDLAGINLKQAAENERLRAAFYECIKNLEHFIERALKGEQNEV